MPTNKETTKVIVGMSGGVDSSVAALLLIEQGYQVEGLFMKNWEADDDDEYCTAAEDLADARAVCAKLNIPLHTVNFSKQYWDNVFQYFLDEYQAGRTPNPDILCNREIKFKCFLEHALGLGADKIATGHYARVANIDDEYQLQVAQDTNKDQTYFLYTLGQAQLQHVLFPIGELQKADVRIIADKAGFVNHAKKDSTGICFIGERNFKDFLSQYLLAKPGEMLTPDGEVIGQHDGLMYYTLGQRQGLNIGGRKDAGDAPWYVVAKDVEKNQLIVGQGSEHPLLYSNELVASELSWVSNTAPTLPLRCSAKIRYRQSAEQCEITTADDGSTLLVSFDKPQRAITPGQSVVFYAGDNNEICLGGGIIRHSAPATFCAEFC